MSSAIYIEPSLLELLSEEQETFTCILTLIGQVTLLTAIQLLAISLSQTSFGHISTKSLTIPTVLKPA